MKPIFVIGNPRSGTTIFRLMLNQHSALVVPPECGHIIWWERKYADWRIEQSLNKSAVDEYIADLKSSIKIENWHLDFNFVSTQIQKHRPKSYAELVSLVYECYSLMHFNKKLRWGDKNNFHTSFIQQLHGLFPEASFIHIIRDGRDVASSYLELSNKKYEVKYSPKLPSTPQEAGQEWYNNNMEVLNKFETISEHQRISIKYEDLVLNTSITLQRVCNFLGITFEAEMQHFQTFGPAHESIEAMPWKQKTSEPLNAKNIGRYKRDLTRNDMTSFEANFKTLLQHFGYVNPV